jgi:hypothetical protein
MESVYAALGFTIWNSQLRCTHLGHASAHRRMARLDTLAVELLLAGVTIDQVSTLLGHRSVKVTEKHSAPLVQARQAQL